MTGTFIVHPGKEAQNQELGRTLRVIPARNASATETTGVAVFAGPYLKFVLDEEHALKLANAIADTLEGSQ